MRRAAGGGQLRADLRPMNCLRSALLIRLVRTWQRLPP
jgi:hypothetical protein